MILKFFLHGNYFDKNTDLQGFAGKREGRELPFRRCGRYDQQRPKDHLLLTIEICRASSAQKNSRVIYTRLFYLFLVID
jgi:hypothetical protein